MLDILFSPDKFFRERAEEPGLVGPFAVVALVGVLGAIAAYPASQAIADALPPEAQGFGSITIATSLIGAFVAPFVIWILVTALFHGLSSVLYDAEGSFKTTFALTGWGFVPAILTAAVGIVVAFLVWPSLTLDFSDPARAQQFAREVQQRPEFLVSSAIGIVILLWRGLLWTFGMQHGRGLEFREALVTVGIPVGLLLIWRLYGLVF